MKKHRKPFVIALLCGVAVLVICAVVWIVAASRKTAERELEDYLTTVLTSAALKPEDTDVIKWKVCEYNDIVYDGKRYDVKQLVAAGESFDSPLVMHMENVELFRGVELPALEVPVSLRSDAGEQILGEITVVDKNLWTGPEPQSYCIISHVSVFSVAFTYVKEAEQGEDQYKLCYYTNKLDVAASIAAGGIVNSEPIARSLNERATVSAETHDDPAIPAIEAYLGLRDSYDYINYYEFAFFDGAITTERIKIPTPFAESKEEP